MKPRWIVAAAMTCVLLFSAFSASALIGNKLFGKKGCLVGCGRGPFGIAPIGDLFTGANELAFGPALKAFEERGKSVVDYAAARFDEKLVKLDASLNDKLSTVSEMAQDSIGQFDAVLKSNIDIGLEGLSRKIASLDILGTKKTDELSLMLKGIVILATFAALLYWIAGSVDRRNFQLSTAWHAARWRIAAAVVVLLVLVPVALFVIAPPRLPGYVEELEADYSKYMGRMEFQRAAFLAEQLATVEPNNEAYRERHDTSSLLRDTFFNPTTYLSLDSLARTEFRLLALMSDYDASVPDSPLVIKKQAPLEISLMMITWQVRQDDATRMKVANMAADVLSRPVQAQSPLRILAVHYLRAYLRNPVHPFEWDEIKATAERSRVVAVPDDFEKNYEVHSIAKLQAIVASAEAATTTSAAKSYEQLHLETQINFAKGVELVYAKAIPSYVRMVELHQQVKFTAVGPARAALVTERTRMATQVKQAWEQLLEDRFVSDANSDLNLRMTLVAALHATYTRALRYASADEVGTVPPVPKNEDELSKMKPEELFHAQWLEKMSGQIRPQARKFLEYRLRYQYLVDSQRLMEFETAFAASRAQAASWDLAKTAAESAGKLGLFVCVEPTASLVNDVLKYTDCAQTGATPIRAPWYVRALLSNEARPTINSWLRALELSLQRPIPVI